MQFKSITVLAILLLVVVSLSVAGCTSTTTPGNPTSAASSSPSPSDEQRTQIEMSATQGTVPQQISTYTPKAGNKFVAFNVTIKNIDTPKYYTNPYDWQLRDTAGGVYQPATATYSSEINGLKGVQTQPGDVISGLVVFEVPQNAQLKSITNTSGANNFILDI